MWAKPGVGARRLATEGELGKLMELKDREVGRR